MKKLNSIILSGKEVLPLVEGGKGINGSNAYSSGAWAHENCVGTFSAVSPDALDNNGNVIKEIKTKVEIDSVEKTKTIFENSGLFCWCDYINQNYEYRKGEVVINVQYVKELGTFIEIEEFNSIKNKTDEEKFEILSNIIKSLGFPIGNDYSCKKPYMFLKKKQAK